MPVTRRFLWVGFALRTYNLYPFVLGNLFQVVVTVSTLNFMWKLHLVFNLIASSLQLLDSIAGPQILKHFKTM